LPIDTSLLWPMDLGFEGWGFGLQDKGFEVLRDFMDCLLGDGSATTPRRLSWGKNVLRLGGGLLNR
jgi:hypothetical protein